MEKLLIIDGNSIINRAFYGIKLLTNKHGLYTNGIYGFLNIMFKNLEELNPEYIAVAFDLKAPTFRHKAYAQYKAQRKGMPQELAQQMPVMKEILSAMNITVLEKEGYEADDIIGTVSRICRKNEVECYILTGDKDDLQLATDTTKVLLTVTKGGSTATTELDADDVEDMYGVTPTQFIDVKGLMGDTSDNVPGVKGIGEKTAFEYIKKFKSIEKLYENLDDPIVKPAARRKLEEGRDMAFLSKSLCTIDVNVPLDFSVEAARRTDYDNERLAELFANLEFNSFLKKLGDVPTQNNFKFPKFELLEGAFSARKLLENADTFIYKLFAVDGELYSLAFLTDGTVHYLKAAPHELADLLKPIVESSGVMKISADIKSDMVLLNRYGMDFSDDYFDISVGAYIINPLRNNYDLSGIAMEFIGVNLTEERDFFGSGKKVKTIADFTAEELSGYLTEQLGVIPQLKEYETDKIKNDGQEKLLYEVEFPLIRALATMETEGFCVDESSLKEFDDSLGEKITVLEEDIYSLAGEKFNINSPKQLGVILFEKLGLKAAKKTKTGYSTNAEVLEKLVGEHEIVEKILDYRQLAKLKSTYGDGLLAVINHDTGRVYSKFNQTVTVTGRISSTEPNLQNIPVRTELGREIRKMFVAGPGCVLVDADYSQIELRLLAHISGDENLINAFKNNEDIHASTAANIFSVPISEVTPLLRSRAKTVNFGIVYGMGDFSLAKDLGITVKEARKYIDSYFEKYPKVKQYMEQTIQNAKEIGYVSTLFGRRRIIPEISSSNFMVRSSGERMARNTPIQGTAADIIKIAMVSVERELRKCGLKSKLILQVHDELIIETLTEEENEVRELLKTCMENAAELSIPLVAETQSGASWYDAH